VAAGKNPLIANNCSLLWRAADGILRDKCRDSWNNNPFIDVQGVRIYQNEVTDFFNSARLLGKRAYDQAYVQFKSVIRERFPGLNDDVNVEFIFNCIEPNCQKKINRNRGRVCNGQCYYDFTYEPKPRLKLGADCRKTGLCCLSTGGCASDISQLECSLLAQDENADEWTWYEYTNEDPVPEGKVAEDTDCNDQNAPCGACADYCLDNCDINGAAYEELENHENSTYAHNRQAFRIVSFGPFGMEGSYGIKYKDGAYDEFNGCSYFFWFDGTNNWSLTEVDGNLWPCRVGKSRIRVFQINCATGELLNITQQIIEPAPGSTWQEDLTSEFCDFPLLFPTDCDTYGGCPVEPPEFFPDPTISCSGIAPTGIL
jgi:hypothetical protein